MSKPNVKRKMRAGWAQVIQDAEAQIQHSKIRIRELKAAIGVFRDNLKKGVPVPGSATQN